MLAGHVVKELSSAIEDMLQLDAIVFEDCTFDFAEMSARARKCVGKTLDQNAKERAVLLIDKLVCPNVACMCDDEAKHAIPALSAAVSIASVISSSPHGPSLLEQILQCVEKARSLNGLYKQVAAHDDVATEVLDSFRTSLSTLKASTTQLRDNTDSLDISEPTRVAIFKGLDKVLEQSEKRDREVHSLATTTARGNMTEAVKRLQDVAGGLREEKVWSAGLKEDAALAAVLAKFRETILASPDDMDAVINTIKNEVEVCMRQDKDARSLAGEIINEDDYLDVSTIVKRAVLTQVEIRLLSAFDDVRDAKTLRAKVVPALRTLRDYKMQMKSSLLRAVYVRAEAALSGN